MKTTSIQTCHTWFRCDFYYHYYYLFFQLGLFTSSAVLTAHSLDYNRQELLPGGLGLRAEVALQFAGDGDGDAVCQQLRTKQQPHYHKHNDKNC